MTHIPTKALSSGGIVTEPGGRAGGEKPSDYTRFKVLVEAVTTYAGISPSTLIGMLNQMLQENVQREIDRLAAQPGLLRHQLNVAGNVQVLEMLRQNIEHLGNAVTIRERFSIPRSTLHRMKDKGKVIAFRPSPKADFLFPFEQFMADGVCIWAENLVAAVGNGAPAIHFLYVTRKSLGEQSFAEALREQKGRDVHALLEHAITRLIAE